MTDLCVSSVINLTDVYSDGKDSPHVCLLFVLFAITGAGGFIHLHQWPCQQPHPASAAGGSGLFTSCLTQLSTQPQQQQQQ